MRKVFVLLPLLFGTACSDAPAREADQFPMSLADLERRAPADSPAEANYRRTCLACHGTDGRGNGGTTGADLTSATGVLARPDEELLVSVRDGKRGSIGVMPPHGALLREDEIRAVLAYVRQRFGAPAAQGASSTETP